MNRRSRPGSEPPEKGRDTRRATRPIDRCYYDTSGYFSQGGEHLRDPSSHFHLYRIHEVLNLCGDPAGVRAVDLGCGWGTISFALARYADFVVGIDFASESLRVCASRRDPRENSNLVFLQADARQTALRTGTSDLVVAADLIEHLYPDDTEAVYREAWRLLRPGGRFIVWTPSPTHIIELLRRSRILRHDPTHVDYKTLSRVRSDLAKIGFQIVQARHAPSHLPGFRALERIGQRWIPWLRRRVAVAAKKPGPASTAREPA